MYIWMCRVIICVLCGVAKRKTPAVSNVRLLLYSRKLNNILYKYISGFSFISFGQSFEHCRIIRSLVWIYQLFHNLKSDVTFTKDISYAWSLYCFPLQPKSLNEKWNAVGREEKKKWTWNLMVLLQNTKEKRCS